MTVSSPPPPPPPPSYPTPGVPGQAPKKGGLPWYAWVGIGCVVLLMLGLGSCFVVGYYAKQKLAGYAEKFEKNPELAAVELMIQANPDYEVVSTDEESKRITIRETKTGKEATFDFEQIKSGNFSIETEEGTSTIGVGGTDDGGSGGQITVTGPEGQTATFGASAGADLPSWVPGYPGASSQGGFSGTTGDTRSGTVALQTSDSIETVLAYYERELEAAGYTVEKNTYATNGQTAGATLTAKSADASRDITIILGAADGTTTVSLSYSGK